MESLDLFAWDKMELCDHSRWLKFFFLWVHVFFFFCFLFFETVSVKTLMSAYFLLVPERKHQFIMVGKGDEVCFDNNVSSKSVRL